MDFSIGNLVSSVVGAVVAVAEEICLVAEVVIGVGAGRD
ncbi:hypothetical protein CLOBY_30900 [Clostridium saccharobutylicum]|uniref:Uncharacterized protein n=1 Tax=Clostridium saccharobutylicum DSM 13864 TaxID=1345695 RepID=U5MUD1_CLOSA|nr:hypothetical protein CLSA_c31720 [Clostridium saccharobutylicum DSM 13864]AQR91427.1 hypothetical protein CLOSC_31520 [Clostridium saccharobutylicum]AQS01331.1 hypothetical protein CSACC_31590 [Clostridium saccharobutylicum]AQS10941.1 hypothetical protein CLOBY_30900 [Clostridium saccharobutylicum]AQS15314.1 hypothetical protein CLOSACC_31590 [Clostridium saccharobutylicum]